MKTRTWLLVALVALIVSSLAGPASATRGRSPVDPRLLVVGDSVILGARNAILGRLGGSWQVNVVAQESISTYAAASVVDANRASLGEVAVVGLGNNDGADPGLFAAHIDTLMQHLSGVRRVIWVNLRQFRSWVPAANATLRAATARWPNLEIADWDARSTPDASLVYGDGLHLTPTGQAAMAELIAKQLQVYVQERNTPTTTTTRAKAPARGNPARPCSLVDKVTVSRVLGVRVVDSSTTVRRSAPPAHVCTYRTRHFVNRKAAAGRTPVELELSATLLTPSLQQQLTSGQGSLERLSGSPDAYGTPDGQVIGVKGNDVIRAGTRHDGMDRASRLQEEAQVARLALNRL